MNDTDLPTLDGGAPTVATVEVGAEAAVALARQYAALSGPFAPKAALVAAGAGASVDLAVSVSAALAAACETGPKAGWLMRATERAWDLKRLKDDGGLEAAVRWRRDQDTDAATTDLLDALEGKGAFHPTAVADAIEEAEIVGAARPKLRRLAAALEWSAPLAAASPMLERVHAALNRADQARRGDLLLSDGFHGRVEAADDLTDWICGPEETTLRALYVSGLPAIGKSTLLEYALRQAAGRGVNALVARLDFDRAGLDVLDRLGLTLEVARQVASQAPEIAADLRKARLEATVTQEARLKGGSERTFPYPVTDALAAYLKTSGRKLVIALDTLENLRGRGETHPHQLFEWLDQMRSADVKPLTVVAAGRGAALEPVGSRVARTLHLDSLTLDDAEKLLADTQVPPALRAMVADQAEGNPMQLRLLGEVARQEGEAGLKRADSASVILYRSLEARLGGRYGKIARFIPLFRRFDSGVLGEVIAPVVARGRLPAGEAADLWVGLKEQTWLIRGEVAPGWLAPHPDLRKTLAAKLRAEGSSHAFKLHRRAAAWFAERTEPWAASEALYHRLQATRREGPDALKDMNLEAGGNFDSSDLEDLPAAARDALLRARGERSYEGRGAPSAGEISPGAVDELRGLLSRGDFTEATFFYERLFAPASIDPTSEAAEVAMTLLWRIGRWGAARRLLKERAWTRPWDLALFDTWPEAALARLEMRAEFNFVDLRNWLEEGDHRAEQAVRLTQNSKVNLGYGALGFALGPDRLSISSVANPVAAALALWSPNAPMEDLRFALATAHARRQQVSRDESANTQPFLSRQEDARLLAVLSPYGELGELLLRDRRDGPLSDLLKQLAELAETLGARHNPADLAPALSALGLAAEWLSAVGALLGDADLRMIGRAAERWRRTTAGLWSYRRRPVGWAGWESAAADFALDAVTEDRVARLLGSASPYEAAHTELFAWAGGDAAGVARLLRSAKLDQLRRGADAFEPSHTAALRAASQLTRRWIPAAFVPALAILAIKPRREG